MATSKLDDVTNALIATFAALPALAGVPVYDAEPVTGAADPDLLLVGDDGDPESSIASTYEQQWTNLACTTRQEVGEVMCAAISQSGDTDMQARRDRVFGWVAACENSLRADITLGGVVASAHLIRGSARPVQNDRGAAMVAPFTVAYLAHI